MKASHRITLYIIAIIAGMFTLPSIGTAITPSDGSPFEKQQSLTTILVQTSLGKINSLQDAIAQADTLSDDTQQTALDSLESLENELTNYIDRVESAETQQDLQDINQDLVGYLQNNKESLINTAKLVIAELAEELIAEAEELITQIGYALVVLERTCPEQPEMIEALQTSIDELETSLDQLSQAIGSGTTTEIRTIMKDVVILSKETAENAITVSEFCGVPMQRP